MKTATVLLIALFIGCSEQQEQPYYRAVMLANQVGDTLYLVEERDLRYSSAVVWEYVTDSRGLKKFKSFRDAENYAIEMNTAKIKARLDAEARHLRRIK